MTQIQLKSVTLRDRFMEYADLCLEGGFIITEPMRENFQRVITSFESGKTGVLLCGNPGSSKTMIFEILQRIIQPKSHRAFIKKTAPEVVTDFNISGHEVFRMNHSKNVFYDDLGLEDKGHYYAERIEVFEKIIHARYEFFRYNKVMTHFTTNLLPEEIEKRYGAWFFSRIQEMCSIIPMDPGQDFRPLKNFKQFPSVFYDLRTEEDIRWAEYYSKTAEQPAIPQPRKGTGSRIRDMLKITLPKSFNGNQEI